MKPEEHSRTEMSVRPLLYFSCQMQYFIRPQDGTLTQVRLIRQYVKDGSNKPIQTFRIKLSYETFELCELNCHPGSESWHASDLNLIYQKWK